MPKASDVVPSIFERDCLYTDTDEVSNIIPKFGTFYGTAWCLPELSKTLDVIVSECNGDLYLGMNKCGGISNALTKKISDDFFRAVIEDVGVNVIFSSDVPDGVQITDPFKKKNRCMVQDAKLICKWPEQTGYQVNPEGMIRLWDYTSLAITFDCAIIAILLVSLFAGFLKDSKTRTAKLQSQHKFTLLHFLEVNSILKNAFVDIMAASTWTLAIMIVQDGSHVYLHPNTAVICTDWLDTISLVFYAIIVTNASMAGFLIARENKHVFTRSVYETAILFLIVALTPVSAAPEFHALFEACVGISVMFINARDVLWEPASSITFTLIIVIVSGANIVAGTFLTLPLLVDCIAVPSGSELLLSIIITAQVSVAAFIMRKS